MRNRSKWLKKRNGPPARICGLGLATALVVSLVGLAAPGSAAAAAPLQVKRVDATAVVTPDSGGRVTIPFCPTADPCAFPQVPDAVVVTGSLPTSGAQMPVNLIAYGVTTTGFTLRALNQAGTPITTQITVFYHASLNGAGPGERSGAATVTTDASGYATVPLTTPPGQSGAPVSVVASGVGPTQGGNIPVSLLVTARTATSFTVRALEQNGAAIASDSIRLAYLASWQARSQPTNTWSNLNATVSVTTDASGYAQVPFSPALPVAPTGIQVIGVSPSVATVTANLVGNNGTVTGFRVRAIDQKGNPIPSRAVTVSYHVATGTRDAAAAAPRLALPQYSRNAVVQGPAAASGTLAPLDHAYINNIGRLRHGFQKDPNLAGTGAITWTPFFGSEEFTAEPALAQQADGRLQLVALNASGTMWVTTQTTKATDAWGAAVNMGGLMASPPAVVRDPAGLLSAFAIDSAGALWVTQQVGQNGPYGFWSSLGLTGLTGTPVAVNVGNGIRVFARDASGVLKTAMYADRSLSSVTSLAGSGFTGTPAAVVFPGNKVRVFARAANGAIMTMRQADPATFPATWDRVGTLTAAGSPAAVLDPLDRAQVVVKGTDATIYYAQETAAGSGVWRDWVQSTTPAAATDPVTVSYTDSTGPSWAYVYRASDDVTWFVKRTGATLRDTGGAPSFRATPLPAPPAH
ncbi:MAG TPA: hypothetical protein VF069_18565 [Streptosporangiaceae bacterium]